MLTPSDVCTFLAPRDLLVLSSVCVILNRLALADAHWRPIAERLWSKRQLTRAQRLALASRQTTNWRRRYYEALRNAKRTRISKEEVRHSCPTPPSLSLDSCSSARILCGTLPRRGSTRAGYARMAGMIHLHCEVLLCSGHASSSHLHRSYLPSGVYLGVYGEWPWHWVKKSDDDEDEPCTEEQATGVQIGPFYVHRHRFCYVFAHLDHSLCRI